MRQPLLALLLGSAVLLAGCSSNRALLDENTTLREDLDAAYAELNRLRAENESLERQLRESMQRVVESSNGGERGETVAVLPTDILFPSGSAELSPEGVRRMAEIAGILRAEHPGRVIRIEGYTDDRPIGPNLQGQYPSNWELSAARAATVARHLQWTHQFDGGRMEIVGLSEYHPTTSNATPEGRQQNRRVRIAVMD